MRRSFTVCALLVMLVTAALLLYLGRTPRAAGSCALPEREIADGAGHTWPAPALSAALPPVPAHSDFQSDFLNLIAPFENNSDTDPFLREKRSTAFQARINRLAETEIISAYQAAVTIQNSHPTEAAADLRDRLLQRWRELDPSLAIIEPLPASTLPGEIIALSETDPITAARRALDQLPPGQEQTNILIGIVQRLAATDPASALNWVSQFPQGELRDRAFLQLRRVNASPPAASVTP